MPVYEYECTKCAKVHEVSQKMADAPLAKCPGCGARVRKIMSLASVAIKTSGSSSAGGCPMAESCGAGRRCGTNEN